MIGEEKVEVGEADGELKIRGTIFFVLEELGDERVAAKSAKI